MLTTDFTGTYDYEKEEAQHAASYLLEDLSLAYITLEEFPDKILKELTHWKKCIPDTFDDFERHFKAEIESGMNDAIQSYIVNQR